MVVEEQRIIAAGEIDGINPFAAINHIIAAHLAGNADTLARAGQAGAIADILRGPAIGPQAVN